MNAEGWLALDAMRGLAPGTSERRHLARRERAARRAEVPRVADQVLLPIGPLVEAVQRHLVAAGTPWGVARMLGHLAGVERGTAWSWIRRGTIEESRADRVACRLGLHPAMLWGVEWLADVEPAA